MNDTPNDQERGENQRKDTQRRDTRSVSALYWRYAVWTTLPLAAGIAALFALFPHFDVMASGLGRMGAVFGLVGLALVVNLFVFRKTIGKTITSLDRSLDAQRVFADEIGLKDPVTGLANRARLEQELALRAKSRMRLTLLQLDLDGFRAINNLKGTLAGDKVLLRTAERLEALSRDSELIARTGADEFVVVMAPDTDLAPARARAEKLLELLPQDIEIDGEACHVDVCIGVASGTPKGDEGAAERVLANADIALSNAKARGRGEYVVFSSPMRETVEQTHQLVQEIQAGLERREFIAHYQPQTARDGKTIVALEALARWRHPVRGLLNPGDFIDVAEEIGLVDQIDKMVLDCTLRDIEAWRTQELVIPRVSVNVSARRLYSPRLIEELRSLKISRGAIAFEVLETVLINGNDSTLKWNLDGLRELGIEIEVDDFGTGRASILSVLALCPSRLKVAREIVQASAAANSDHAMLQAIIALGRAVGVEMVAEGVETQRQLEVVAALGFERLQGFAIARPMPASDVPEWLSAVTVLPAGQESMTAHHDPLISNIRPARVRPNTTEEGHRQDSA